VSKTVPLDPLERLTAETTVGSTAGVPTRVAEISLEIAKISFICACVFPTMIMKMR